MTGQAFLDEFHLGVFSSWVPTPCLEALSAHFDFTGLRMCVCLSFTGTCELGQEISGHRKSPKISSVCCVYSLFLIIVTARLIYRSSKFNHVTPLLHTLHWLPSEKRIDFKLASLCFKSLNGSAPTYISGLLHLYTLSRQLHSSAVT